MGGCRHSADNLHLCDSKDTDSLLFYKQIEQIPYQLLNENKIDSAILITQQILDYCEQHENSGDGNIDSLKISANNAMGFIYNTIDQKDKALEYYHEAEHVIRRINDMEWLQKTYLNIADTYYGKCDFMQTVNYYRKALWLSDSLNFNMNRSFIYVGLGIVYANLKNYKLSDYYYQIVEKQFDSLKGYVRIYFSNNRAIYYYQTKEYDKALEWLRKAKYFLRESPKDLFIDAQVESNIGEMLLLLHQPDSAKVHLDRAANIFLSPDAGISEKFYINGLYASMYLEKNNLKEAEKLLTASYPTDEIYPNYLYYNNERLATLYAKKGDYRKAYEYRTKTNFYNDSVLSNATQNNIAEIEIRYSRDTSILRRDILVAQRNRELAELKHFNTVIYISGLGSLTVVAIFLLYYKQKRNLQFARQIATIAGLRMENVRNRISPHFTFNALNAVLPALQHYNELAQPLQLLVQSIRSNLMVSEKISIPLSHEIEMVRNFISLYESTGLRRANVRWLISENVDMNIQIPSMSIQIPVENALKYAFTDIDTDNCVSIKIDRNREKEYIKIEIEDNGVGLGNVASSASSKGTGHGLKILYKTIELLNTKNAHKLLFSICNAGNADSEKKGTIVTLSVPIHFKYVV
ncbi:MAG: histidine kinase [Prevotellaceae bacterium]|nr:histidine kinase [Prevotellaceae bacterium]